MKTLDEFMALHYTTYPVATACKPSRIYVAGALSGGSTAKARTPSKVVCDYITNLHRMISISALLRKKGYCPYIPGLDLLVGMVWGNFNEEDYRGMGMSFLDVCDAVLVISMSSGVQREIDRARKLGIPVYCTIAQLEEASS